MRKVLRKPKIRGIRILCTTLAYASVLSFGFVTRPESAFNDANRERLGICITGQLCRLELENKVNYLFRPSARTFDVQYVFVLSQNCKYTNRMFPKGVFTSSAKVLDFLAKSKISEDVITVAEPDYSQIGAVNARYVHSLDKKSETNNQARALNHLRQWVNLKTCYEILQPADLYVRVREDLIFFQEFVPSTRLLGGAQLAVPRCLNWRGGLNDKAAVISQGVSEAYFTGSFHFYYHGFDAKICTSQASSCSYRYNIQNPEQYMKIVMQHFNVSIAELSAFEFPSTSAGRNKNGKICFKRGDTHLGENLACVPKLPRTALTFKTRMGLAYCSNV